MNRKLNVTDCLFRLRGKGIRPEQQLISGTIVLDISKAKDLGNKSWGYIDFLRGQGMELVGFASYRHKNSVTKEVQEYAKQSKPVIKQEVKKWYEMENFDKDTSEYLHLLELNHFQEKLNREKYKKSSTETKLLKKIRVNLDIPFTDKTILQWNADNIAATIITNKQQNTHQNKKRGYV